MVAASDTPIIRSATGYSLFLSECVRAYAAEVLPPAMLVALAMVAAPLSPVPVEWNISLDFARRVAVVAVSAEGNQWQ